MRGTQDGHGSEPRLHAKESLALKRAGLQGHSRSLAAERRSKLRLYKVFLTSLRLDSIQELAQDSRELVRLLPWRIMPGFGYNAQFRIGYLLPH